MWLRHRPLVQDLQRMLHKEKVIGEVFRVYSEFGLGLDIPNLPDSSRYKQPHLGAGSLLDLGIYTLTWAILGLDAGTPGSSEKPKILAAQSHDGAVEVTTIVTSTTMATGNPKVLARIQGAKGTIEVHGIVPSDPDSFTVYSTFERDQIKGIIGGDAVKTFDYKPVGRGYYWEADNAALDVLAGKLESDVMPWAETVRVMEMMDEIRRQGGLYSSRRVVRTSFQSLCRTLDSEQQRPAFQELWFNVEQSVAGATCRNIHNQDIRDTAGIDRISKLQLS
ncbi:hypothetical protein BDP81DRAFT_443176 [Colletotrichum phormii]|uniref:D-xylose 1-dehydrogenase n=1 Tax=Colletotrichum phormii TaxID=359342 RepID=A0AAI9ZDQ4_9PEZI|nr:uncharacterized protein BDP81DRAFT_443176 [Colletotrichum phormii]KAK1621715.1 hypothetical protein BDP81DRAFT_443176 [Colletotrichum phormii]